jgi:hypothetical protein
MPTLIKNKPECTDANLLQARPDHLAAIGLVALNWNSIEEGLQQFFCQILSYQVAMGMSPLDRDHPLLLANVNMILPEIEALRPRLAVISAVVTSILGVDVGSTWDSEFVGLIRSTAGKRATIVHGRWIWSETWAKHLILYNPKDRTFSAYTVPEIVAIATEIRTVDDKLAAFFLEAHRSYVDRQPSGRKITF